MATEQQQRDAAAFVQAQQLLSAGYQKQDSGDALGALDLFEQCQSCALLISIEARASATAIELAALGSLGGVCNEMGQYERAMQYSTRALTISRGTNDKQSESAALGNIGTALMRLGQYKQAIEHRKQALIICRELPDREGEQMELANLGIALDEDGRHEEAIKHFTEALAICRERHDRKNEASYLSSLGTTHTSLGNHEQAVEILNQALRISCELGDRSSEAHQLSNLGRAINELGQPEQAVKHYMRALSIFREFKLREAEGRVLLNLGMTHLRDLDDPAAALPWLQQDRALYDAMWDDLSDDKHRVSYGDTFSSTGRALQVAHARLSQPEAAIEEAERARSRSFEVLLAQQRVARGVEEAAPSASAASVPISCDVLVAAAERQKVTIVFFSMIVSSFAQPLVWIVRAGAGVTVKQISLPSDDASLTQLVELTRRTIGARSRHGEAPVRSAKQAHPFSAQTVDEDELAAALGRDMELMDDEDDETELSERSETTAGPAAPKPAAPNLDELLRRCHELLIAPLGLADGEPLLLVPDGQLYSLPFAALLDADGKHLIERHSLRVAPSIGTVVELEARAASRLPAASPSAVVVGNPSFHGWAPQLPAAEVEAERVCAQLTAAEFAATKQLGAAATKAAVVEAMRGRDVIHLATHGTSDGVLLGGATLAEGKLSMGEVQSLELRARLVVLSECDSFRGKLTSDGVIGITRAFVAAGALSLVASLWKVDDAATRALMERFYERLLAGGALGDVAAAMQGAMVSMILEQGRWTVLQWAAFVVYGLV